VIFALQRPVSRKAPTNLLVNKRVWPKVVTSCPSGSIKQQTWDQLAFGLRAGAHPKICHHDDIPVMTVTDSGILVGCLEDVYSKKQTGSDILIAVTLRSRQ
jgi:hypothetical protein